MISWPEIIIILMILSLDPWPPLHLRLQQRHGRQKHLVPMQHQSEPTPRLLVLAHGFGTQNASRNIQCRQLLGDESIKVKGKQFVVFNYKWFF